MKRSQGLKVFDIQLKPDEQEISIPDLIERVVNQFGPKVTNSSASFRELVYEVLENEKKSAAREGYRDEVERTILRDISGGRLSVDKYGNRDIILVASLVRWTFSYGKNVLQSGIAGRESYAAAAKTAMLERPFLMTEEREATPLGERETSAAELADKGITTAEIVEAFDGLVNFNLGKAMTDGAAWTSVARISKGTRGGRHKSLWDPVILATALQERKNVPLSKLNQAFNSYKFLARWREDWNRFSAM